MNKRFKVIVSLLLVCLFVQACSSHMKNVMIDKGNALTGPEEPSICVSQKDNKYVVAGANIRSTYHSKNKGKTWTKVMPESSYGVYGDPCIVSDDQGNFYFLHLSNPDGKGWASDSLLDRIVCQHSSDHGKTWNNGGFMGLSAPKDQDKEWAIVDNNSGIIYATWTQFDKYNSKEPGDSSNILFSASKDNGLTWSDAKRINQQAGNCLDDNYTVEGAVPAVGPNGEIYVAWAYGNEIYFDKSEDGGKSWLENDIVVATGTGGWNLNVKGIQRSNGMPVTVCDLSGGEHHGAIYVNWCDTRNGNDNIDVWLAKSTDGGDTWSEPIKVNDDTTETQQFLTWMAVDQTNGNLYTVFYDRRNHQDVKTDVYMAYSVDGGDEFVNVMVSDSSFTPNEYVFFGDYNNISAHGNVVRPIWTRLDKYELSIWTALIDGKKLSKNK